MTTEPFKVDHPGPNFLIIIFMAYDFDLPSYLKDRHLEEMALGAGPDVAILAITDTATSPGQVVEVTSRRIHLIEDLDEIDTGEPRRLGELLARALITYPGVPRIAIGFAGHGTGIFNEGPPEELFEALALLGRRRARLLHSAKAKKILQMNYSVLLEWPYGRLTNYEIGVMLRDAFAAARREATVDLLFFDTCFNGMIEVVTEFAGFAECVVASEELEPHTGWRYDKWLALMNASSPADPAAWGGQAVEAMAAAYAEVTLRPPVTLSAVAAGRGPVPVVARFKALVDAAGMLSSDGHAHLVWARDQSMKFGEGKLDSYDLGGFARHLATRTDTPPLAAAAEALAEAVDAAVLHRTPLDPSGAHGLAFWFPRTRQSFERDIGAYVRLRFDRETGWSSYLDRHF